MKLQIKGSQNNNFDIEVEGPELTIAQLKQKIAAERNLDATKIRLIYSGKILADTNTISFYNIPDGHAVHMVVSGKSAAPKPAEPAQPAPAPQPAQVSTQPLPNMQSPPPQANPFAGLGGLGGMGGMPGMNPYNMDPSQISAMMNNPFVQNMMNQVMENPEMLRQMLDSNPMIANNPAARAQMEMLLQNPEMTREAMNMFRSMGAGANTGAGATPAGGANPNAGANPFGMDWNSLMNNPEIQRLMNDPQAIQDAMRMFGDGGFGANPFFGGAPAASPAPASTPASDADIKLFFDATKLSQTDEIKNKLATTNGSKAMKQFLDSCRALRKEGINVFPDVADFGASAAPAAGAAAHPAPSVSNEERFQEQLKIMNEMGLNDNDKNIRALLASNGNVNVAIERIFSGMP
ncbi:Ubiquitin family protein [Trichomonas vaginalis G3]|uniref:Ubiquitin family protein n=1 Tax=Trichomonas vaginalis (strain ATCC PRA-98 / G3) TaxID=412133 RepID=A2E296_TRIV3|nr:negative regulation of store-operated calcium channel protein [Trichomonas vaginalis G3]EAY13196.1 Ubiquitin family protein [Trichomonas vaginalis G3]KAI5488186.1 negative regulation of store-operated calcium channel protein [Trichomonas vaginalis G3]|eukprot:XP_001325419.1 Ubiquitin family protein [Trichomonas vaginalis G3]